MALQYALTAKEAEISRLREDTAPKIAKAYSEMREHADKMTGEIANLSSRDFDANAAAAILDPQKANDDRYYGLYGKTSAGPYTVTSALGLRMRIDQMTIDGVGARPSRLRRPRVRDARR